ANATMPDFEPEGSLALKPWFGSDAGIALPPQLALPVVLALPPYDAQVAAVNRQIGCIPPRQPMKDASGASQMDAQTQVSSLHGVSMLQAATQAFESLVKLALLHELGDENDRRLVATALAAHVNLHGTPELAAAQASRDAGNAPNAVLAAAAAIVGPRRQQGAREAAKLMIDRFAAAKLKNAQDEAFDIASVDIEGCHSLTRATPDERAQAMLAGLQARGAHSVFVRWLGSLAGYPTGVAVLAAITTTLAWGPLSATRVSRMAVERLPGSMQL